MGDDGRTVKGTFAWRNPDAIPSAGNASGEWDFIPDADYYMYENGHGTVDFTVLPKDIGNAVITLGESHKYNGSEQTQTVVSVKLGEMTLSESDYDISGDKATDVKTDGSYVLTITGKGNFSGTKTAEWNIIQANPKESVSKKTTAKVLKGKTLADAKVSGGEFLAYDGITALDGTFAWIDDTKVINSSCTEQMTFTPNDKNYAPITFDVAVSIYSWGGGASYSSHIVNFETNGGSAVENQAVKWNDKVSRPIDPKKEGYEFGGWFVDKELRVAYDFDTKVMKNFTLYAAWIKVEADYNPFNDVDKDYWYYDDVIDAVKKGLFNGTGSNTFAPNAPITRGMFITVLYRADGEPEVNATLPFTDIAENSYYAKAVIWAQQNGIVFGVSETEFAPNKNITREQIAAIMFRYAKYKGYDVSVGESTNILSYTDAEDVSEYAAEAVQYVVGSGLMKGKTETTINPRDKATRAEIAAILNRFIDGNK